MRYTLGSMMVYIASSMPFQVVSVVKVIFTNIEKRIMDVIKPLESTRCVSNHDISFQSRSSRYGDTYMLPVQKTIVSPSLFFLDI